jgi:hypothetical protein
MSSDVLVIAAGVVLALCIALPSIAAYLQKLRSREGADVAVALADYAGAIRRERRCVPLDETLLTRAQRLGLAEMVAFEFVCGLPAAAPDAVADAAQRLSLRLKRRVAFERKMLARTASGRRRAAVAAVVPAVAMLALAAVHIETPRAALGLLLSFEALGCWLLWRVARVEA